jgi:tRNA(1-methyladenosine) methyltransferase and related methyltransferases
MSETPSSGDSSSERNANTHRRIVRERYSNIATDNEGSSCCDPSPGDGGSCCEDSTGTDSERLGYAAEDVEAVAGDADLGLGCGNPKAIADLETGETVLDLGSGAGFDCFLAAREVGSEGRVIGVDMTPEMIETARENVEKTTQRTSNFGSVRSNISLSGIRQSMLLSRTASSISHRPSHRCSRRRFACLSRMEELRSPMLC